MFLSLQDEVEGSGALLAELVAGDVGDTLTDYLRCPAVFQLPELLNRFITVICNIGTEDQAVAAEVALLLVEHLSPFGPFVDR